MTAYTTHADSLFDPNKPILGSTHLEARDNLLSVAEGDDTAPKIDLPALERLAAGSNIRSRQDGVSIGVGTGTVHSFGFIQIGTIRCIINRSNAAASTRVTRRRNGVDTVVVASAQADVSSDIDVIPGDVIFLEGDGTGGPFTFDGRFATDGGNLWPGSEVRLEGNNV